jgi:hypothetical protein
VRLTTGITQASTSTGGLVWPIGLLVRPEYPMIAFLSTVTFSQLASTWDTATWHNKHISAMYHAAGIWVSRDRPRMLAAALPIAR